MATLPIANPPPHPVFGSTTELFSDLMWRQNKSDTDLATSWATVHPDVFGRNLGAQNDDFMVYIPGARRRAAEAPSHSLRSVKVYGGTVTISDGDTVNLIREQVDCWTNAKSGDWAQRLDKIIIELGRLKPNWDGEGAPAPSQSLLTQMEQALQNLPRETREPDVEIDPSDNSIALRWWTDDNQAAFAMTFTGNGRVYGVTSSSAEQPAPSWDCLTEEETKIIDKTDHPLIKRALFETA